MCKQAVYVIRPVCKQAVALHGESSRCTLTQTHTWHSLFFNWRASTLSLRMHATRQGALFERGGHRADLSRFMHAQACQAHEGPLTSAHRGAIQAIPVGLVHVLPELVRQLLVGHAFAGAVMCEAYVI